MSIISTPNENSVEGIYETSSGKQRVVMTSSFSGTQTDYSESSVECIVQDGSGNKQRCVCVTNFSDAESSPISAVRLGTLPQDDGNYRLRLTIASGVPTLSWVAE